MFECPHCRELTISTWAKWRSRRQSPAYCSFCSQPTSKDRHGYFIASAYVSRVFWYFFLYAFVFGAFYFWHWWPLALYATLFIADSVAVVKWRPLIVLDEFQVQEERKSHKNHLLILALIIALAAVHVYIKIEEYGLKEVYEKFNPQ